MTILDIKADNGLEDLLAQLKPGPKDTAAGNNPQSLDASRLSLVLQTTLELPALMELFYQSIRPALSQHGLEYKHPLLSSNIKIGKKHSHTLSYHITLKGEELGELVISRKWEFSKADNHILEITLYSLLYPLRNALTYSRAVRAAQTDPLTGVKNRTCFEDSINREIDIAHRSGRDLSLLVVDIDHFKAINDSYGHAMGDCVIQRVAQKMAQCMRKSDMLFRYGGEEFVLILSNTPPQGAHLLADRIRKQIENATYTCQTGECDEEAFNVTVSLGVTSLAEEDDLNTFFQRADEALYDAKQSGRNQVRSKQVEK